MDKLLGPLKQMGGATAGPIGFGVGGPGGLTQDTGSTGMRLGELLLPALIGVAAAAHPAAARGAVGFSSALNAARANKLAQTREARLSELFPLQKQALEQEASLYPTQKRLLESRAGWYESEATKAAKEAQYGKTPNYGTEMNALLVSMGVNPETATATDLQRARAMKMSEEFSVRQQYINAQFNKSLELAKDENQRAVLTNLRMIGQNAGSAIQSIQSEVDKEVEKAMGDSPMYRTFMMSPSPEKRKQAYAMADEYRARVSARSNERIRQVITQAKSQLVPIYEHGRMYGMTDKQLINPLEPYELLLNPPAAPSANPAPATQPSGPSGKKPWELMTPGGTM